jgi:hypothetical protein
MSHVNWAGQTVNDEEEYGGRPEHSGKASAKENRQRAMAKARAVMLANKEKAKAAEKARKAGVITTDRIFPS